MEVLHRSRARLAFPVRPTAGSHPSHQCHLAGRNACPAGGLDERTACTSASPDPALSKHGDSDELVFLQGERLHLLHEAQAQLLLPRQGHALHGHGQPHGSCHSLQRGHSEGLPGGAQTSSSFWELCLGTWPVPSNSRAFHVMYLFQCPVPGVIAASPVKLQFFLVRFCHHADGHDPSGEVQDVVQHRGGDSS